MIGVIRVKDGVTFAATDGPYLGKIAPAGFRILAMLDLLAAALRRDLTISSGSDGCHSGQHDPHHTGEAYDIRTHDIQDIKLDLVDKLRSGLGTAFYAFLEDAGGPNEHIHCQRAKSTVFPPEESSVAPTRVEPVVTP